MLASHNVVHMRGWRALPQPALQFAQCFDTAGRHHFYPTVR